MYRLLIVTNAPNVKDRLEAMQGWEILGFKPPRIRTNLEEAVECIHRHHIDAIAVEPNPVFDGFVAYLNEHFPNTPLFQIASSDEEQLTILRELSSLLSRLKADDTNDDYDEASRMQEYRERWLKKLIGGVVPTCEDLKRHLSLYRCSERMDVPCVLARLEMPQDDSFFSGRWRYGSERLEIALRNFFGHQHDHMILHVAVVSPQEVRVLCYPADGETVSENAAFNYVQETAEQIDHYLGLNMKVLDVRRIPGLTAFVAENAAQ